MWATLPVLLCYGSPGRLRKREKYDSVLRFKGNLVKEAGLALALRKEAEHSNAICFPRIISFDFRNTIIQHPPIANETQQGGK